MAKLYPPYIEGTIPAFYKTVDLDGTVRAKLTVPFSMNRAVSKWEVIAFSLKVKNVFGDDDFLISATTKDFYLDADYRAIFNLEGDKILNKLEDGQFYKIQIAYISNDGIGYYSTVGIVKCTTEPTLEISNLSTDVINLHKYSYVGTYAQANYKYEEIEVDRQDYKPYVYYQQNIYGEWFLVASEIYAPPYYTRVPSTDENDLKDATEKVYQYRFVLTDFKGNVVTDSGYLLHNSNTDINSYESKDEFAFPSDLQDGKIYYIQYSVITNNNLEISSPRYRIMQKRSIAPDIHASVNAIMNYENGYVDVKLLGELDDDGMEKGATGSYLLTRSSSDDNFEVWSEVLRFGLYGQKPSRNLFRDFTVEQGKTYIYSLQQYNDAGLYSMRIKSNEVYADFEDAFLYDGKRQLKIKYNPKISSFKTGYLETKVNTIGSQFPFIFRNGNVAYKEFPLSGLISYQSDEENLFISDDILGLETSPLTSRRPGTFRDDIDATDRYFEDLFNMSAGGPSAVEDSDVIKDNYNNRRTLGDRIEDIKSRTTSLVNYNIQAERKFKLEVLDWLNDGKVKLFRSPTEGNYLIKLMNVSLTPEEKTGRMLHSFSSTAYEIAECTYDNLNYYGIISVSEPDYRSLRWESLRFSEYDDKETDNRYDPSFTYEELINYSEEDFNAAVETANKNAKLDWYTESESGVMIQISVNDRYDKKAVYYTKDTKGVYLETEVSEEEYQAAVSIKLDNLYLDIYRKERDIFNRDTYVQVKSTDNFEYSVQTWKPIIYEDGTQMVDAEGNPVLELSEQILYTQYYKKKVTGPLYYIKTGINLLSSKEVTSLRLVDMTPGDTFILQLENWSKPQTFTIGATGAYLIDTDVNIIYFGLPEKSRYNGLVTYSYYENTVNLFSEVEGVEIYPVACRQFIGAHRDKVNRNILTQIENVRDSIANFYYINVYKRSVGKAYYNPQDQQFYRHFNRIAVKDGLGNISYNEVYDSLIGDPIYPHENIDEDYFEDPFMLYSYTRDKYENADAWTIISPDNKKYEPFNFFYDPWAKDDLIVTKETYDRLKSLGASVDKLILYSSKVLFDERYEMSLEDIERYSARSEDLKFDSIVCDVGIAVELGYELQSINYSIMRNNDLVAYVYNQYLVWRNILEDAKTLINPTEKQMEDIYLAHSNIDASYNYFIEVLTEELRKWEAEQNS